MAALTSSPTAGAAVASAAGAATGSAITKGDPNKAKLKRRNGVRFISLIVRGPA